MNKDYKTLKEIEEMYPIKSGAIRQAAHKGRIQLVKINNSNYCTIEDIEKYVKTKHKREIRRHNNKYIYEYDKDILCPAECANEYGIHINRVYYGIYRNRLKHTNASIFYLIKRADMIDFMAKYYPEQLKLANKRREDVRRNKKSNEESKKDIDSLHSKEIQARA